MFAEISTQKLRMNLVANLVFALLRAGFQGVFGGFCDERVGFLTRPDDSHPPQTSDHRSTPPPPQPSPTISYNKSPSEEKQLSLVAELRQLARIRSEYRNPAPPTDASSEGKPDRFSCECRSQSADVSLTLRGRQMNEDSSVAMHESSWNPSGFSFPGRFHRSHGSTENASSLYTTDGNIPRRKKRFLKIFNSM